MARKSKLTSAVQAKIVQLILQGVAGHRAAEACGLAASTYYGWMKRGKAAKSGKFRDFFEAVTQASAQAEAMLLGRVNMTGQAGDWRASVWILERRWPERWGRQIKMSIDFSQLSDEQLDRMLAGEHPAAVLAGAALDSG